MGTENYDLPLINGADSVKIPRDFNTLSEQLDGLLHQEISRIDNQVISLASGSPRGVFPTLVALQTAYPTGGPGIYVVVEDGKWYYWNGTVWAIGGIYQSTGILENSVAAKNTTFMLTGKNLFDKSAATIGYYVYPSGAQSGKLVAATGYSASDYINVIAGTTYSFTNNNFYAWYDANKTFISSGGVADGPNPTSVTSPANAKYLRISLKTAKADVTQVEKNATLTAFEPFRYIVNKSKLEDATFVEQFLSTLTKPGKNLFDKSKATYGGFISDTTGNVSNSAGFYYSDYIPVAPNTQYTRKGTYSLAFYDASRIFISGLNGAAKVTTFTTPANCAFIRLSTYETVLSGVAGINEEQVELGPISTVYEKYGFIVSGMTAAAPEGVTVNLPKKSYGLVGQELNIYFDNLIEKRDNTYDFDVTCAVGAQYQSFYRITPATAGTYPLQIDVYKEGALVATATTSLIVSATSVGNAVNKKLLIIGDSTTDNAYLTTKITENFNADVMDITLLGTRGTAPNKHEGRAGWTTDMYMGNNASYVSPFVFGGVFDFAQYLSTNAIATPDYVVLNLGINDLFASADDATMTTKINTTITQYNTIIASVKAQDANTKIVIALTIPPNYSQDAFGIAYGSGQTQRRYKKNNVAWVKKLIETYSNRETEKIYVLPIHQNLDTRYNFGNESKKVNNRNTVVRDYPIAGSGVHPDVTGYWQIADSYWYFIKSFES